MNLTYKEYREALEDVITNILELESESTIWKNLIHNECDCIGELVNISDTDIPKLCYKTSTKSLKLFTQGNIILSGYLMLTFTTGPMILTLLVMTGRRLLRTSSMNFTLQDMTILEYCAWLVL